MEPKILKITFHLIVHLSGLMCPTAINSKVQTQTLHRQMLKAVGLLNQEWNVTWLILEENYHQSGHFVHFGGK